MNSIQQQLQKFAEEKGFVKPKKSLEEQVKAINTIVKETKSVPDYRFTFGKYSGELLENVIKKDRTYLVWISNQAWLEDQHPQLCSILEGIL